MQPKMSEHVFEYTCAHRHRSVWRRRRAWFLAAGEGLDVPRFKELGLTISPDVGYRLSPRGRAFHQAAR